VINYSLLVLLINIVGRQWWKVANKSKGQEILKLSVCFVSVTQMRGDATVDVCSCSSASANDDGAEALGLDNLFFPCGAS
jgi:hypothetical protein